MRSASAAVEVWVATSPLLSCFAAMTWILFICGLRLLLRALLMWLFSCIALCVRKYWANSVFVVLMIVSRSLSHDMLIGAEMEKSLIFGMATGRLGWVGFLAQKNLSRK